MYDKNNDQLMYCVFNPSEPRFAELYDNSCEITLEFDSKYRAVELWHKGKMVTMTLVNNKIKFNIDAGHMICVLPY